MVTSQRWNCSFFCDILQYSGSLISNWRRSCKGGEMSRVRHFSSYRYRYQKCHELGKALIVSERVGQLELMARSLCTRYECVRGMYQSRYRFRFWNTADTLHLRLSQSVSLQSWHQREAIVNAGWLNDTGCIVYYEWRIKTMAEGV